MSEVGNVSFGNDTKRIAEAIEELAKQIKGLQQADSEESLKLAKYAQTSTTLEFILITGGLIKGKIVWSGSQSIGVETNSGQKFILYKHTIAFIQEQTKQGF
jgi:hypothetical protein